MLRYKLDKPLLINRGTIKGDTTGTLKDFIGWDYMGNAYFESGAQPRSLCRISETFDKYDFVDIPELTQYKSRCILSCWMDTSEEKNIQQIKSWLIELSKDEIRLEEWIAFHYHFKPKDSIVHNTRFNMWWDIRNDFFFSFDSALLDLPNVLTNTFKHMKNNGVMDSWWETRHGR